MGVGVIFTPVGGQCTGVIHQLTTFEEISHIIHTVVVERVGIECGFTMLEHHIVSCYRHLVVAVVVGIVAE